MMQNRYIDNLALLDFLDKCISKYKFLRMEQLLRLLDNGINRFNEEPKETLQRWNQKIKL